MLYLRRCKQVPCENLTCVELLNDGDKKKRLFSE